MGKRIKYYYETVNGFKREISREKFYSMARRKNARKSFCTNNGYISSRCLKFD